MSGGVKTQCFSKTSNKIADSPWQACGVGNDTTPIVPCCASADTCLAHGLCHYTHSKSGGTGFYIAGCTDSAYTAKNCPRLCTSQAFPDVVWNTTTRLWQCCGANARTRSLSCDDPTEERFDAPGPKYIKTYWPRQTAKGPSRTRAVVGGVVAAVVVVLLLLIAVLVLRRRRHGKQQRREAASDFDSVNSGAPLGGGDTTKAWKPSPVELQNNTAPVEMGERGQQEAIELPGPIPRREEVQVLPSDISASRI